MGFINIVGKDCSRTRKLITFFHTLLRKNKATYMPEKLWVINACVTVRLYKGKLREAGKVKRENVNEFRHA